MNELLELFNAKNIQFKSSIDFIGCYGEIIRKKERWYNIKYERVNERGISIPIVHGQWDTIPFEEIVFRYNDIHFRIDAFKKKERLSKKQKREIQEFVDLASALPPIKETAQEIATAMYQAIEEGNKL